ncbi:MAG TPA: hypothetical protein VM492_12515 [Sumerlaeia bacterium]|nr:hypothetical protein [Sumerlaeia bacterium]
MSALKATLENLAERVAASEGGRITPNDLVPYLPVSLELIEQHLDEMVDGSVVVSHTDEGVKTYEFPELLDAGPRSMERGTCIHCGAEASSEEAMCLCYACHNDLGQELMRLAESTAWPADAVWEHELLFITSTARGPIRIADVAGRSRLTLSQVKQRLRELATRGYARAVIDEEHGVLTYEFPPITYRRAAYRRHDAFIRLHPSSLKDEWEVRIVKSLLALVAIVVVCFVLTFVARISPPVLILGGAVVAGFSLWRILTKKTRIEPERIGQES